MLHKVQTLLFAKYRACSWLSCYASPRADVLRGWARWYWLSRQRRLGRLIEPSVRFQGDVANLDKRVFLGVGACLDQGCVVWLGKEGSGMGSISLAERVYVGPYSYLGSCNHKLTIGEDTMIGAHSYIITENHCTKRTDIPYAHQGYVGKDVFIGKNVWIGCHAVVLPGVTIGDHAVIGAGAVVTKSVPSCVIWAGVPAKLISKQLTGEMLN